jgi:hypothetical protein
MTGLSDRELRARFDALRAADEHGAPGFGALLAHAARAATEGRRLPSRWRLRTSLSIAAALLLAVGLVRWSRRRDFVPQPLSTWTSPTAGLLHTPGSELLASSGLLPSVLDQLTSTSSQRKGK